jgi:hypothetical protein
MGSATACGKLAKRGAASARHSRLRTKPPHGNGSHGGESRHHAQGDREEGWTRYVPLAAALLPRSGARSSPRSPPSGETLLKASVVPVSGSTSPQPPSAEIHVRRFLRTHGRHPHGASASAPRGAVTRRPLRRQVFPAFHLGERGRRVAATTMPRCRGSLRPRRPACERISPAHGRCAARSCARTNRSAASAQDGAGVSDTTGPWYVNRAGPRWCLAAGCVSARAHALARPPHTHRSRASLQYWFEADGLEDLPVLDS